jgi:hypothetical protein
LILAHIVIVYFITDVYPILGKLLVASLIILIIYANPLIGFGAIFVGFVIYLLGKKAN